MRKARRKGSGEGGGGRRGAAGGRGEGCRLASLTFLGQLAEAWGLREGWWAGQNPKAPADRATDRQTNRGAARPAPSRPAAPPRARACAHARAHSRAHIIRGEQARPSPRLGCARRESSPGHKHGGLVRCRYTTCAHDTHRRVRFVSCDSLPALCSCIVEGQPCIGRLVS